jgi:hypothetical protein
MLPKVIMRVIPVLLLVVSSRVAVAGSDKRDCETRDRRIVMGAGNSTNRVQIKYLGTDGKMGVFDAPVKILPHYDYNTPTDAEPIFAVPIKSEKFVSKKHQTMHVKHKDGSTCEGRESWDDRSVQSYVLVGRDGESLARAFVEKTVEGMTSEGYVVAEFQCHTYGETSTGGCSAGTGDDVTWR